MNEDKQVAVAGSVAVAPTEELNIMSVIARAASDPNVQVDKMERLLQMHGQLQKQKAEREFIEAINAVQRELPRIKKNGVISIPTKGVKIAYSKYEDIMDAVNPLLLNHGLTTSYTSDAVGPQMNLLKVTITVRHIAGHSDSGSVFLPISDSSGAKNAVQGSGSILSYGKRYALCQYLNIVMEDEDDDATMGLTKPISQDEVNTILDMVLHTGADQKRFLEYMGVSKIEEIMVKDYPRAMQALESKQKRK